MKKFVSILITFLACLFISPKNSYAVSISINSFPSTISSLDQFQVGVSVTGATNATNYLRIDLYKDGSTNYFGETYNGSAWYNASDGKSYFPIQIQDASASATIVGRLGGPNSSEYSGSGSYKLKIRRYTASGNPASDDTQTPVDVQISYIFPTPTPTLNPTTAPTPTPTPVKSASPIPVKSPTPRPILTPTPTSEVLGSSTQPDDQNSDTSTTETTSPESVTQIQPSAKKGTVILGIIFVVLGIFAMGIAGYAAYIKSKGPNT